ncbi:hypothetical protein [Mycobacterium marinum]|uniref:hypothetical protein n=1 Tax=Mycobacterium marinum TaxID=1781 RepID=UPI00138E2D4C
MKQDKKELIYNYVGIIILAVLSIGLLYALVTLPSNPEKSSSNPEYKEWKQHRITLS